MNFTMLAVGIAMLLFLIVVDRQQPTRILDRPINWEFHGMVMWTLVAIGWIVCGLIGVEL